MYDRNSLNNYFYIYGYFENTVPFYMGKGKDYRYLISHYLTLLYPNRFLKNKILKIGKENIQIKFLHKDLTEEQAFYLEEYYITGSGNKGRLGQPLTEETRKKLSLANKGNQHEKNY